jgi:superfamily II DNA or RNA helicase
MAEENIYTTSDKGFAGKIGEEFSEKYLFPTDNKKQKKENNQPQSDDNINIFGNNDDVKINIKKKGRPTKNCIDKLNSNEFKDNNFIHEDFLYNKSGIFNSDHYNECNIKFLKELYYNLKKVPFKNSSYPLDSKAFLIDGRHDERFDIDGILELQKKYITESNTDNSDKVVDDNITLPNNDTSDNDIDDAITDSIYPELDINDLKNDLELDNQDIIYKDTKNDEFIFNNNIKIPSVKNESTTSLTDFKDYNEYLLHLEKKSYNYNTQNDTPEFLYPDLDDPKFSIKIAKKKEFYDNKYENKVFDIKEQSELLCNSDFELMPHQIFVRNFLSSYTPYNSLLLFHSVGTGKTCSAIGIAEETRNYFKYTNSKQKEIIIVASPNVQTNFKLQLFDPSKLKQQNGIWTLNTCVGNSLISEINPTHNKDITEKQITKQINNLISTNYNFMGYIEFANFINRLINVASDSGYSKKQLESIEISLIQKYFNNRLIIIDEVHNIRTTDDNLEKKRTTYLLMKIAKYANNMKLLLLSATPMYNSYKEIIWITNLLNLNDKRGIIRESDIFDNEGNFKESQGDDEESGKDLLQRKLIGYISYVQGENPYSFPFRIYPQDFSPEYALNSKHFPNVQMNNTSIEFSSNLPLYIVNFNDYQQKCYNIIIQNLKNYSEKNKLPNFENLDSFGYNLLQKPLESLNIVYPKMDIEQLFDKDLNTLERTNIRSKLFNSDNNIDIVGKSGLRRIMNFETKTDLYKPIKFNYEYKPDILSNYGRIFSKDELPKYSAKISKICNNVMNSKGIVLIYSMYIEGGVIPIALALEELGFTRYSSSSLAKPLFKDKPCEPIDSLHMKPKSELKNTNFKPARYALITGDSHFSHNNAKDITAITNKDNTDGSNIKVVIISKAASEGLDFKNIRQVHILEPWYNMNRVEQIIGRGVRNLSHCMLPFEERNVEIYMYATAPIEDDDNKIEIADMYLYRLAEKKAKLIGNVTRLLKTNAIDCNLNISQTNFSIDKFKEFSINNIVNINLSSNKTIEYEVGNKPYSSICDYMDNCNFQCVNPDKIEDLQIQSENYNSFFSISNYEMIVKRVKQLFQNRSFYRKNDLIDSININKKYPIEQILYVITVFMNNKELFDNFGRRGFLINKGDFYLFQPIEIEDLDATTFERTNSIELKKDRILIELPDNNKYIAKSIQSIKNDNIEDKQYDVIIQDLKSLVDDCLNNDIDSKKIKANSDWYTEIKSTELKYFLFQKHNLSKEHFKKYIVFHYLDTSKLSLRLNLLNGLYNKNNDLSEIESFIQLYFESKMVYKDSDNFAIILKSDIDDNTNNLYVLNNGVFNLIEDQDRNDYNLIIMNKFLVQQENIYKVVGFMHQFKNENVVFKMKDFFSKYNNKGSYCKNSTKEDILRKINCLLNISNCDGSNETEPENENTYYYTKQEIKNSIRKIGICIISEFLFRYFDEIKFRNKRYFFNPEEVAIIDISNLPNK